MSNAMLVAAFLSALVCAPDDGPSPEVNKVLRKVADGRGWLKNFDQGTQLRKDLSDGGLAQEKAEKSAIGTRVAFAGKSGGGSRYEIGRGLEIEIVDKNGMLFDPHKVPNVTWTYILCGRVKRISVEDQLIVLEVLESDWEFMEST